MEEQVLFDLEAAAYLLRYPAGDWWCIAPEVLALLADEGSPKVRLALRARMQEAFAGLAALGAESAQEEYTRLFISDLPHAPCRPVEAFYLEDAIVGRATGEVAGTYASFGVAPLDLPPDHVVSELAFLGQLLRAEEPQALAEAARFRERHLLQWLPRWVASVAHHARQPFYAKVAAYALAAVEAAKGA